MPHGASKAEGGEVTTGDEDGADHPDHAQAVAARLEKAVLAGEMDRDEARVQLGLLPLVREGVTVESVALNPAIPDAPSVAVIDHEALKTAVAEAIGPALAARDAGHAEELASVRKELKGLRKVADAIADQPDPNVTAYRGVALAGPAHLQKTSAQVVPGTMAERAERAQATMFNALYRDWRAPRRPRRTGKTPGTPCAK